MPGVSGAASAWSGQITSYRNRPHWLAGDRGSADGEQIEKTVTNVPGPKCYQRARLNPDPAIYAGRSGYIAMAPDHPG